MSKKQLIAMLCTAKQVKATQIGGITAEDWPRLCNKGFAQGFILNGDRLEHPGGRYLVCPKFTRIRLGTFHANSKEYDFTWDAGEPRGKVTSYGQVTQLKEVNGALEMTMFNGAVLRYEVVA